MRPPVVRVGDGKVRFWPLVVWEKLKVVATSTVAAAVPIAPPVGLSPMPKALSKVLLPLVKVDPVAMVKPPLKVPRPVTPRVPPRVVAPVPTFKVLLPLIETLPPKLLAPAVTVRPPAVIVSPPAVTVRPLPIVAPLVTPTVPIVAVPPMLASWVTASAVPVELKALLPVKVWLVAFK